tara:strand:+ start:2506 stop:3258 length:753 start_codon:yes stop_codon:yes gene_type:complete
MTNWFLITSGINVDYGFFNSDQRFEQTLETISSIRKKCNDSKIVLIEGAAKPLTEEQKRVLLSSCDIVLDCYSDDFIKFAHANHEPNVVKHPCELYLLYLFLNQQDFLKENDRIYKICGRYYLNDNFNYLIHESAKGKLIFGPKLNASPYYGDSGLFEPVSKFKYRTRLYSFDGTLIEYMKIKYKDMFDLIISKYKSGEFTDVEHVMYAVLDQEKVLELSPIGLSGYFADYNATPGLSSEVPLGEDKVYE